ncbi:uncharacterized protein FOMMEDRAFT_31055 [Fomitiporia mediterranea MF3/22]|uniref:uncharacterized protein n=1 Tax=Fomitiporia mediterranea (strain MF3/22) TaxID=694068 RepID=UPI0004409C5F|nr:uncharacterized protein FOMMEDRAFT_31055 [Fomitiporia mediterranea MF3/22]EJC99785.1 hypothetical protein FOMMEDRAFT_31055 [Fomitiporia mediterranea MF3/22]
MTVRKSLSQDYIDLDETSSKLLGSGASGTVRKFHTLNTTEQCAYLQYAVKIFNRCSEMADETQHYNRITREAEIWTNIKTEQYRNINKLKGFSLIKDSPYPVLVMGICKQSLDSYWRSRRINTKEKLNLFIKMDSHMVIFGCTDTQRGHEHYCAPELFKQKNWRPVETLKKEGKLPVVKSSIARPKQKYWFLLQSLWSTDPAERLKAEKVLSEIDEFIIDCRSNDL